LNKGEYDMISKKILVVMFYTFVLGLSIWELFSWGSSPLDKTVAFFTILLCLKGIVENLVKKEEK
jgi:hypothetical protein